MYILAESKSTKTLRQVELAGLYQEQGLVFSGPGGKPLESSSLTRNWGKHARCTGCPDFKPHDLRHAHAAGLIKTGAHPRVVRDRLGHASAACTMQVSGHVAAGLQEEAAKAFSQPLSKASDRPDVNNL